MIAALLVLLTPSCPLYAETAEAQVAPTAAAPTQPLTEPATQPTAQPIGTVKVAAPTATAEVAAPTTFGPVGTAEVAAPAAGKKADTVEATLKVTAVPDTLYITPGSTCDLSKVKLDAKLGSEAKAITIDSWTTSTGSVNLTTYTPPSAIFQGTVTLSANYNYSGESKKIELELKVRKSYVEERLIVLYTVLILAAMVLLSIKSASSGKNYFIRRIGGLNAIDEAIGRSTEMGKPVLYLTGLSDMSSIATIASVSILSYVATKTAEYQTALLVPCCRSLVMNTAREVVKESYLEAGKPDAYKPENIKYITDDQFGFVSGVDGIMLREKPAANFYLGTFMAESLIYAETGNSIGAIQIAGTSEFSQIPFFVAACDYCLIGEELFAASAYLSRKPKDVGTLRGQDIAKLTIIVLVILGAILETVSVMSPDLAPSLGFFKSIFQTK
jgi:hypothetical protein